MKNIISPIILFVYNRPIHTRKTLEALQKNELASESELFIFSDGPKIENDENIKKVREYIKTIDGFKSVTIIEREKNLGLANSVISGVTEIIDKYGKVIVLEDDIVTSKYFLGFMNEALDFFENDSNIFSISGFSDKRVEIPSNYKKEIYLSYRFGSWGWATWRNCWDKVDWIIKDYDEFLSNKKIRKEFNRGGMDMADMLISQMDGKIDSWAIRFDYAHFKNNCFNVRPVKSLVSNIGCDGSGVHCGVSEEYKNDTSDIYCPKLGKIEFNKKIVANFRILYKKDKPYKKYSIKRFLSKITRRIFS